MFERTSARLPVCQNRDVLWTELRWYNWSAAGYGSGNGSISEMNTVELVSARVGLEWVLS